MADTKVSGLSAAASLLVTHEFPVNEGGTSKKVTGQMIVNKVAQGTLPSGYIAVTANQTPITTVVDLTSLTVTVTIAAGRRIRLSWGVAFQSTVATDFMDILVMEGATQLTLDSAAMGPAANDIVSFNGAVILTPSAAAHTYKLQARRNHGTGTITMTASTTQPAWLMAEDIGV